MSVVLGATADEMIFRSGVRRQRVRIVVVGRESGKSMLGGRVCASEYINWGRSPKTSTGSIGRA